MKVPDGKRPYTEYLSKEGSLEIGFIKKGMGTDTLTVHNEHTDKTATVRPDESLGGLWKEV